MNELTHAQQIRHDCPRWLSSRCHGGPDCSCLPAMVMPVQRGEWLHRDETVEETEPDTRDAEAEARLLREQSGGIRSRLSDDEVREAVRRAQEASRAKPRGRRV